MGRGQGGEGAAVQQRQQLAGLLRVQPLDVEYLQLREDGGGPCQDRVEEGVQPVVAAAEDAQLGPRVVREEGAIQE
jgi:hypothetical protein